MNVAQLIVKVVKRVMRNNVQTDNNCVMVMENKRCIMASLYKDLLSRLTESSIVCGLSLLYRRVPRGSALRRVRADILNVEVNIERSGSHVYSDEYKMLLALERSLASYAEAVKLQILLHLCDNSREKIEDLLYTAEAYGCKAKLHCGPRALRFFRGGRAAGYVAPIRDALSLARNVAEYLAPFTTSPGLGMPVGYEPRLKIVAHVYTHAREGALHTVVVGPTGKGKTTLLALLATVSSLYNLRVIAIDPKGDLERYIGSYISGIRGNLRFYSDPAEVLTLLETMPANISRRAARTAPRGVVLVDEAWRVSRRSLEALYRLGRSSGMAVVAASQHPRDLSSVVWSNSSNFVIFGSREEDYIRDIERSASLQREDAEKLPLLGTGEALVLYSWSKRAIVARLYPLSMFAQAR